MKILKRLFAFTLLLLVASGAFFIWARHELETPCANDLEGQYVDIPRGLSSDGIINRLSDLGVVRRGWVLRLYIHATGAGQKLKAGEYRFPSQISPLGVLKKLQEGEERLSRLTVIEGWTRFDIAQLLAHIPELKLQSADEALALMDDTTLVRDIDPDAKNLEGYLFPDTYNFPPDATPKLVVETMVKRFRQVWGELSQKYPSTGRTPHDVVTVASLVETEAKLAEDRPLVASVIYNRLKTGMPLGVDSSVIYASKLAGKWRNNGKVYQSDLDRDSPYNTRRVKGLPPGPVSSPGARSLEAALAPADTDYLYYVRDPSRNDGKHNFYSNESDFQRGVQALRDWERTRNSNAGSTPTPSEGTFTSNDAAPAPSP